MVRALRIWFNKTTISGISYLLFYKTVLSYLRWTESHVEPGVLACMHRKPDCGLYCVTLCSQQSYVSRCHVFHSNSAGFGVIRFSVLLRVINYSCTNCSTASTRFRQLSITHINCMILTSVRQRLYYMKLGTQVKLSPDCRCYRWLQSSDWTDMTNDHLKRSALFVLSISD